jgi:hypothetical protein
MSDKNETKIFGLPCYNALILGSTIIFSLNKSISIYNINHNEYQTYTEKLESEITAACQTKTLVWVIFSAINFFTFQILIMLIKQKQD